MSLELIWSNFANYCMQIGLLIGVAAFVPTALRLSAPRARLAFWHVLLAVCLMLPLLAPWRQAAITAARAIPIAHTTPVPAAPPAPARIVPWNQIALALLAAGVAARFGWLLLGLARLRQYRRRSLPLDIPNTWSVEADLRLSADVASPVTFGWLHPVVLLPARFCELDEETRDAILCHEILHVRRKDWLVTIAEECIRSIFWFHPAIWWLLGEIGLSREQAVDSEVIEMTRAREQYVDALLAMASSAAQLDLAPAPLFLRRRHLKHRVVSIMKEVRMSKIRSVSALTAGLAVLAATCWLVTMTFPLSASPQMVADGQGVTVDVGNAAVMHRTSIMYPTAARAARIEGTVLAEATLDGSGNVIDARIVSGPNEFRRAVLQSLLQWHFANDSGANTRQIRITFANPLPAPNVPPAPPRKGDGGVVGGIVGGVPGGVSGSVVGGVIGSAPVARMPGFVGKTLKQIQVNGLTDEARERLMSKLPVRVGDTLSEESFTRALAAVRDYDEHLGFNTRLDQENGVTLTISAPGASAMSAITEPPPPPNGVKRITVGGNVQQSKLVQQPRPAYPPLAKQARISGVVSLQAIINRDGTMQNLAVISGHPLLIPAALEAVKLWVYQPTLLNGDPVEVITQIDVNFTLSDNPPPPQQ